MTRFVLTVPGSAPRIDSASAIGAAWLVRLRWAFAAAEVFVGLSSELLGQATSIATVSACAATTLLTNAGLAWWARRDAGRSGAGRLTPVLVLDGVLLTLTLLGSGGSANPFSVLYIVHVALAALLLDRRATLLVVSTTLLGFGLLFVAPMPTGAHAGHAHHAHGGQGFEAHLRGMLAAYALTAAFVGYFVHRVARELARREREMGELRDWAARTERLASLSALAAGAAHELGSPLATIAVAAKELERVAAGEAPLDARGIASDARLVREEAERCRLIIGKMGTGAGDLQGGAPRRVMLSDVLARVAASLGEPRWAAVRVEKPAVDVFVVAPEEALVQSIVTLTTNALDATDGARDAVTLEASAAAERVTFRVIDRGPGIPPGALRRLGEPFFSTKDGRGMGLGLFLARSFAERVGGHLQVESKLGSGSTFVLEVPGGVA